MCFVSWPLSGGRERRKIDELRQLLSSLQYMACDTQSSETMRVYIGD